MRCWAKTEQIFNPCRVTRDASHPLGHTTDLCGAPPTSLSTSSHHWSTVVWDSLFPDPRPPCLPLQCASVSLVFDWRVHTVAISVSSQSQSRARILRLLFVRSFTTERTHSSYRFLEFFSGHVIIPSRFRNLQVDKSSLLWFILHMIANSKKSFRITGAGCSWFLSDSDCFYVLCFVLCPITRKLNPKLSFYSHHPPLFVSNTEFLNCCMPCS